MKTQSNHVELSYTLEEKEILDGMKISGVYRTNGKKSLIQMILLLIVFGIFLVSFIISKQIYNLLLAVFALIVVAAIYFLPLIDMKRHAKKGEKK